VKADAHLSVVKARVRSGEIARHAAIKLDAGRAFLVTTALGLPRMWGYVTDPVLDRFSKELESTRGKGAAARLEAALNAARAELALRCDVLVERQLPDVTLVALLLEHGELHVLSAGPGRAYLHRRGDTHRLTPREDRPEGLLKATPAWCTMTLEPSDLVLTGSISAFSVRAVARLTTVLDADPKVTPSVVASVLTEPATKAGVGAAAVVLRIV